MNDGQSPMTFDDAEVESSIKTLVPSSAFKSIGYIPDENVSSKQMLEDWKFIEQVHGGSAWWIGDWLNRAEKKKQQWGASIYDEAIAISGFEYKTLTTYKWMAARINFSNRLEKLSIKHHLAVAPYEPDQQRFLLAKAKELGISAIRFREQIPSLLGIVTVQEESPLTVELRKEGWDAISEPTYTPHNGYYTPPTPSYPVPTYEPAYHPTPAPIYVPPQLSIPDVIREQRRLEAQARIEVLREKGAEVPTGTYSTLVVDPPWPMQKIERDVRPNQVEFDYPTMSEEELFAFPLPGLAADDCHLYLWVTQKHLPLGLRLAEHWGFKYQCLLTWVKNVGFTPFSWMYSTEHVLFCTKGSLPLMRLGKRLDFETMETAFKASVREHSRKPDVFYELVKEVSPAPRMDVFSREKRDGFDQYGNEVGKYDMAAR